MRTAALVPRCKACGARIAQGRDGRWYIAAGAERPTEACGAGAHEPIFRWCDYCHDDTPHRRDSKGKRGWRWRCIPCSQEKVGRQIEEKRARRIRSVAQEVTV